MYEGHWDVALELSHGPSCSLAPAEPVASIVLPHLKCFFFLNRLSKKQEKVPSELFKPYSLRSHRAWGSVGCQITLPTEAPHLVSFRSQDIGKAQLFNTL